jgi:choline transport protein
MGNSKLDTYAQRCDDHSQHDRLILDKGSTARDQRDMYRMGKQQELRRNFRFVSIFGYSMVLMATWETMLTYVRLHFLLTPPDTPTAH